MEIAETRGAAAARKRRKEGWGGGGRHELPQRAQLKNDPGPGELAGPRLNGPTES